MNIMKVSGKKYMAIFALGTLLTLSSGLCYGMTASADVKNEVAVQAPISGMEGCGEPVSAPIRLEKKIPSGNSIMPCCVDRHDKTPTTVPSTLNDRVNFSDITVAGLVVKSVSLVRKQAYVSSSGPPLEPDKLSSLLKKE